MSDMTHKGSFQIQRHDLFKDDRCRPNWFLVILQSIAPVLPTAWCRIFNGCNTKLCLSVTKNCPHLHVHRESQRTPWVTQTQSDRWEVWQTMLKQWESDAHVQHDAHSQTIKYTKIHRDEFEWIYYAVLQANKSQNSLMAPMSQKCQSSATG